MTNTHAHISRGKRSKYGATKVWMCEQGHQFPIGAWEEPCVHCGTDLTKFDSKKEANRWTDLKRLEKAGKIETLLRQVPYRLFSYSESSHGDLAAIKIRSKGYPNGRQVTWTADFVYYEGGQRVIEDVKGMDTPVSRLKRAIVEAMLGTRIRIS